MNDLDILPGLRSLLAEVKQIVGQGRTSPKQPGQSSEFDKFMIEICTFFDIINMRTNPVQR